MDKLKIILSWVFGLLLMIIVLAFSGTSRNSKYLSEDSISIEIFSVEGQYFITENELKRELILELDLIDSLSLEEINIKMLEESLDNHPSIRKAEVYSKLDGSLRIAVHQKQPIARVQSSSADYYIDEIGDSMALSTNYFASVPLINGKVNAERREKLHHFLNIIHQDSFYKDFFSGIKILANDEWLLYPKPGNHKIIFGKAEGIEGKLRKLKIFYLNKASTKEEWDEIKLLNLKFEGQVICRKH
tara:strand:+ start:3292 stop:4026 length:735 start_codon:yes stop_codon:yes gene_type:complete